MRLIEYAIRRALLAIPLIFGVTILIFVLVHMAPGDPVYQFFGMREMVDYNPADIERIRHNLGLDQPLPVQYLNWLSRLVQGDLGYSYITGAPVLRLIETRIWNTLLLNVVSIILALSIAIPVGVTSAIKQYSKTDYAVMSTTLFFWSMPSFWYGIMLIMVFAVALRWFPTSGTHPLGGGTILQNLRYLVLPTIALGTGTAAFNARLVRATMLEVLRQNYILTARSKGLRERVVIYKHALKNALIPVVTVVGINLGYMLSGSAVIENVFAWNGIGRLMVSAVYQRDYPLLMGISLVTTVCVIFTLIITDIVYAYIDPRIKY